MGTDLKRPTLILGGTAEAPSPSPAAPVSPRLALPPPPHIRRSVAPDPEALDAGWEAPSVRPGAYSMVSPPSVVPPVASTRGGTAPVPANRPSVSFKPPVPTSRSPQPQAVAPVPVEEELSSNDLLEDDDRPSDRVTVPNGLAPKLAKASIATKDDESEENARSLATTRPPPPSEHLKRPSLEELALALQDPVVPAPRLELADPDEAFTPSSLPPISMDVRPPLTSLPGESAHSVPVPKMTRQYVAVFAASHLAVAAGVLFWVYATRHEPAPRPREPHIALEDRATIESAAGSVTVNATPADTCVVQDLSRVIAARAELGPPLDATALESGFGVGLVSKSHEAMGIRLEASTLRTAETVKVRSVWPVTRVAVDKGDTEDERLEVRVDGNDTRTLGPTQKITAQKGGVFSTDAEGQRHLLWGIPGYVPKTTETVRAIGRSDGSAVVAVRRPGVMWVGVTGQGPIVPVIREKKTLGTPALANVSAGAGVIAWAERDTGPFSVVVASIDVDGKHTTVSEPTTFAEGISPAVATLPNGELLLAYSDGRAGAHRVVAQRLGADLLRRGELLVLSAQGANAGQPAVAVDGEGRAIVAYLAIENGRAEVHATALSCR